ncbi:hypothetical protein [Streptomyces sp. MI02-7b]|uniref:RipA family octameric membrane protein n=1 Tax=Streptomyces sp. MI02-7b TaxID=462941 RepID=UPI0029BB56B4|nr:hypothetical protein [Streptomyces sp. MI02-7b]MDX3078580.1 hypothetical protein [Streptomyces sp. MI02-7b]
MSRGLRSASEATQRDGLPWNCHIGLEDYQAGAERYQAAIMDQYKICVEMADRISARRSLTNTFFLTINSALLTAASTAGGSFLHRTSPWSLAVLALVASAQCGAWLLLIASYRKLNRAKYKVITALERRLPARVYETEWLELGNGKAAKLHLSLTQIEVWIPVTFMALYAVAGAIAFNLA